MGFPLLDCVGKWAKGSDHQAASARRSEGQRAAIAPVAAPQGFGTSVLCITLTSPLIPTSRLRHGRQSEYKVQGYLTYKKMDPPRTYGRTSA